MGIEFESDLDGAGDLAGGIEGLRDGAAVGGNRRAAGEGQRSGADLRWTRREGDGSGDTAMRGRGGERSGGEEDGRGDPDCHTRHAVMLLQSLREHTTDFGYGRGGLHWRAHSADALTARV